MKKILVISGSRADEGILEWPTRALEADADFEVKRMSVKGCPFGDAFNNAGAMMFLWKPDAVLVLGDRFEILSATTAAHLKRIPIAHLCGGDVSEGSYDDAMRDCISRMATIHFATSEASVARLTQMGCRNVYLVGNPAVDYIRHGPWRELGVPCIAKPYVVVAYYPETIDGTVDLEAVREAIGDRGAFWIKPNPDSGSEKIPGKWEFSHDQFLSVLAHCDEFIGNSSAMLYEAPELGIKTRMIGKRQRGRTIPWGDGKASERIVKILKYTL